MGSWSLTTGSASRDRAGPAAERFAEHGMSAYKGTTHSERSVDVREKAEPALADLALVRQSRLSVVPVNEAEWTLLCAMAGTDPA